MKNENLHGVDFWPVSSCETSRIVSTWSKVGSDLLLSRGLIVALHQVMHARVIQLVDFGRALSGLKQVRCARECRNLANGAVYMANM